MDDVSQEWPKMLPGPPAAKLAKRAIPLFLVFFGSMVLMVVGNALHNSSSGAQESSSWQTWFLNVALVLFGTCGAAAITMIAWMTRKRSAEVAHGYSTIGMAEGPITVIDSELHVILRTKDQPAFVTRAEYKAAVAAAVAKQTSGRNV